MENGMQWLKDRWSERTSWNGIMLIGVGIVGLLFSTLMKYAALAAIAYGAWAFFTKDKAE